MEEVRQLVQEEGREARNLVAFHVSVEGPGTSNGPTSASPTAARRKPPRASLPPRRAPPRPASRLRSASAGRDKRSELRARYWALLFGDLQRAIGEIYNTVETHENLSECQEVMLVLENYTRDFKALGEWFRLKWEYDNTPPPQRPQSLAWEIRKTDFVRPESRRAHSVKSSPSVSGKNSPCLSGHNTPSGKNSPNLTGKASPGSGKISPRISSGHSSTSPKANIEFFSNKIASSKVTAKPEPKAAIATKLTDIKEKEGKENGEEDKMYKESVSSDKDKKPELTQFPVVEIGKAKQSPNICPKPVVVKSKNKTTPKFAKSSAQEMSAQAKATVASLDVMENEFLAKQLSENTIKNDNMFNGDIEKDKATSSPKSTGSGVALQSTDVVNNAENNAITDIKQSSENELLNKEPAVPEYNKNSDEVIDEKTTKIADSSSTESPIKSEDDFADISNDSSTKSLDEKQEKVENDKNIDDEKPDITPKSVEVNKNAVRDNQPKAANSTDKKSNGTDPPKYPADKPKDPKDPKNKDDDKDDTEFKKPEPKVAEAKPHVKPAYSQAAAKPKPVTAKTEIKTPTRATPLTRSKTVAEIRPNTVPKTQKPFPKRSITSKCSYPFNLTTGRTSLFDATPSNVVNKGAVPKKVVNRNVHMAAGDTKISQAKVDLKKRPARPISLKLNDNGDKKVKSNLTLDKIKDYEEYSSSDTVVTQIDMSRIESSESLKTLVPEDFEDSVNSVESLNVDDNKCDNDGWLTVKSRRLSRESKKQSKSHWVNRFNQPSATASLPTLNMIESPKQEVKPIINTAVNRAKSEQPTNVKPEKVVTVSPNTKADSKTRNTAMIRQKSDVTGLKSRSTRTKAQSKKAEKAKDQRNESELTKNRLHSSLESLTTGLARSQESTEEAFDFDKWKAEFMSTFKYLEDDDQLSNHNEILKTADPSEMSEIAEMTSQIEENEKKISWALDFQTEVDQRKLCEEEDLLNRQILELQRVSDIDLDTETDDTETDAEIPCEDASQSCQPTEPANLGALAASLEDQYENCLAGMSWAERVDTLVVLEALVARDPGRAQQLHAKLSQGIKRRGSFQDALRRLQAKQARAERQRMEYQTERAKKIHQLLARVEEVKVAKNQLIEEKRMRMERRLQKAAENRDQHLKDIVRKAHDEEEKLREIAFIKQLEAENRRHEFLEQCRSHTTRLRRVRRDRLHKLEQKAAREAAVGLRRQALEEARQRHVETLLQRRRERDRRVDGLKELRRQERDTAAREKAEGVKSRLSALAAAAEQDAQALRSRIRDKQDASQQRLESHLQAIREKATGPRQPTTSESQDQNQQEMEEEAEKLEQERREREKKAFKKRARKMKQKMLLNGDEELYGDNRVPIEPFLFPVANKMYKIIQQINNMLSPLLPNENQNGDVDVEKENTKNMNGDVEDKKRKKKSERSENNNNDVNGEESKAERKKRRKNKNGDDRSKLSTTESVCSSLSDMSRASCKSEKKNKVVIDMPHLERQLGELLRLMEKTDRNSTDKAMFKKLLGLKTMGQLLAIASEREELSSQFTAKCLTTAVTISSRGIATSSDAAGYFINTNTCIYIARLLNNQLEKDLSDPREFELACQLTDWMSLALDSVLHADPTTLAATRSRAQMLVSYLCLLGVTRAETTGELRAGIQTLLTVCCDIIQPNDVDSGPERAAAAQIYRAALGPGLCGARAEFCALFARGAGLGNCQDFVRAARTGHLLRTMAEMDYTLVQEAFMEGGWALEFRAAVARLLSQHAPNDKEAPRTTANRMNSVRLDQSLSETMVLDLIILVGYVVVDNPQLQETICDNWSVIRTLCTLPANWLVSRLHSHALLPTLAALAGHEPTAAAVAMEMSLQMLDRYLDSPEAQRIKLVQIIKQGRAKKTSGKK